MKRSRMIVMCLVGAIIALLFFSWITMLLWNWLVPALFSGPVISYEQSLGLLILTKILFFGLGGRRHWNHNRNFSPPQWKNRFYEKMSSLTPEEREVFKKKLRDKWCSPPERTEISNKDTSND